jgi:hypothetical protein
LFSSVDDDLGDFLGGFTHFGIELRERLGRLPQEFHESWCRE